MRAHSCRKLGGGRLEPENFEVRAAGSAKIGSSVVGEAHLGSLNGALVDNFYPPCPTSQKASAPNAAAAMGPRMRLAEGARFKPWWTLPLASRRGMILPAAQVASGYRMSDLGEVSRKLVAVFAADVGTELTSRHVCRHWRSRERPMSRSGRFCRLPSLTSRGRGRAPEWVRWIEGDAFDFQIALN